MVGRLRPVRTRLPAREMVILGAGFAVWAALIALGLGLRRDLSSLPRAPYLASAAAWAAAILCALLAVVRPPRGQVLPSANVARALVVLLPLGVALTAALLLVDVPGRTIYPPNVAHYIGHCLGIGFGVASLPVALTIYLANMRFIAARASFGALVGVAGGALGGLVLHLVCPIGGLTHLLAGHVAGMVLGGVLAAIAARFALR
jgi:hypothetical protein